MHQMTDSLRRSAGYALSRAIAGTFLLALTAGGISAADDERHVQHDARPPDCPGRALPEGMQHDQQDAARRFTMNDVLPWVWWPARAS